MSGLIVYGIKSCDTCRKALKWLDEQGRDYQWRDLRVDGVESERVQRWLEEAGAEVLVNRRSTTWRSLGEADREAAGNPQRAQALLQAYPTLIKRPVFEIDGRVLVGFNATVRQSL